MKGSNFRIFSLLIFVFISVLVVTGQKSKMLVTKAKPIVQSTPLSTPTPVYKPVVITPQPYIGSASEQAILEEFNAVRNNPQKYIEYLQEYRNLFKGNMLNIPGEPATQTIEGTTAVDESIEFLKTASKLPPFTLSKGLTQSANLQLKDLMENSSIFHIGKDGSTLSQRLAKFGEVGNAFAENITFYAKNPREIVMSMLIDDGIKSRSHRKNLFSSTFKQVGIGFGKGKGREILSVTVFADSFRESTMGGARKL